MVTKIIGLQRAFVEADGYVSRDSSNRGHHLSRPLWGGLIKFPIGVSREVFYPFVVNEY